MPRLMYVSNMSLDGFIEDSGGRFDWTAPSSEVFAFITDLVRPVKTFLYGRRLYETMAVWETDPDLGAASPLMADFSSVWRSADKVVFTTTLGVASTADTRLVRHFDPDAIRAVTATGDATVGGASLAAHAFAAGLVDECHLFVHPVVLGAGKPAFPGRPRVSMDPLGQRTFDNGVVYLGYRVKRRAPLTPAPTRPG